MEEDSRVGPKISGYLEKKGKLKMMSSYKRYWFVLEGRLLLYYRSKDEYGAISPCKGSINLGPPCNVKPCPALPGVFQIETRSSTITLRAANREDQNRWMQGIVSALNQNKNSSRLSHFRYSLDELSQITNKEKLQSKNSLPLSTSPSKDRSNEEIIQRLQKIGAQSYGGSVGTINQIVNSKKSEDINYSDLTASLQHSPVDAFRNSVLIDNDQYEFVKRNTESDNVELRGKLQPVENIYERLSGDSIPSRNQNEEVNYSLPAKKTTEEIPVSQLQKFHASCDDKILRSLVEGKNNGMENLGERSTFLLSNDIYGISKPITNHKSKENMTRESFILENDNYCSVDKISRYSNDVQEIVYAEPKCTEFTDHNENNLVLSKSKDCTKNEENAYLITKLNESEKNVKFDDSSIYEDLDKYGEYTEPKYQITENIYAESVEKGDTKVKKEKKKKFWKESIENEKTEMKLKKTSSFIKRMWKKKCKHKETEEDIDELYEVVPASVVEKVSVTDQTAVQMLSELHDILEHKKPILKERLSSDGSSNKDASDKVKDKKSITSNANINNSLSRNETAVQMLLELQNILENKKGVLTEQLSERNLPMDSASPESNIVKKQIESKITTNVNVDNAPTGIRSEEIHPTVPPKIQKISLHSPYHDVPKNNQPISKTLPPKKKHSVDSVKSLDEILDDLDKEKTENLNKNNVKKLIKRFSDVEFSDNDVVLRDNKENGHYQKLKEDADTDELGRLLNELAKVTCAPILTPGVTISLINPHLTDEELLKLLPVRRRRYSEPDYDIPRPHKSLINLPRKENPPEGAIGSTRFFGPILKSSDINVKAKNISSSEDMPSMTPDSLEIVDTHTTMSSHYSLLPEDEKSSYTSHSYTKLKNYNGSSTRSSDDHIQKKNLATDTDSSVKYFDNILENDIYAQPKSLRNINTRKGCKINDTNNSLVLEDVKSRDANIYENKLEEIFVDSLEM